MDCSSRSNNAQQDLDLSDNSRMSHEDNSVDEIRDCESIDNENTNGKHNGTATERTTSDGALALDYEVDEPSLKHNTDISMSHQTQFPANHPLGALGNFMGGLHSIPNSDVLEKLKMQVREMKVGVLDQEFPNHAVAAAFAPHVLPTPINTAFTIPPTTSLNSTFSHSPQNLTQSQSQSQSQQHQQQQQQQQLSVDHSGCQTTTTTSIVASSVSASSAMSNGFSFTSPSAPSTKDANPASNSSTSSEASNSSQQNNNGWSFEEQYKQVRQLYEINDDPKRKEFLDDLFSFMQKRGTPINRLPIMAKAVLDLYELYNLVIARGGLVDVINKKLWQEIIKGLHLPSSITSAAFTLRTQYMKFLYPYECEKKNLSSPAELTAAIDGNRREGRRTSYGQFEAMHNQMQMPQIARQSLPGGMQQMSPLALVTHANSPQVAAAAAAAAHHRLMAPSFGQVTHEIEQRMMEYLKLMQSKSEPPHIPITVNTLNNNNNNNNNGSNSNNNNNNMNNSSSSNHNSMSGSSNRQQSQSPDITPREALNALEMSRVALWSMYHNNTSPPSSVNTSPQGIEPQQHMPSASSRFYSEALNLSDLPPNLNAIKRERDHHSAHLTDREDFNQPPSTKRSRGENVGLNSGRFPANYYAPTSSAGSIHHQQFQNHHQQQQHHHHHPHHLQLQHHNNQHGGGDCDDDDEHEGDDDDEHHNSGVNTSNDENDLRRANGHIHHDTKSDDSAIENSPSTNGGTTSPLSARKLQLLQHHHNNIVCKQEAAVHGSAGLHSNQQNLSSKESAMSTSMEHLPFLSGMQFKVSRKGTGANGEQQLVVNLELNGVKYEGVLIANPVPVSPPVSCDGDSIATPTAIVTTTSHSSVANGSSSVHKDSPLDEMPRPLIPS